MRHLTRIDHDAAAELRALRRRSADALARATVLGASVLGLDDERYPPWLAEIADPPAVLWCLGKALALRGPSVAVVGSRAATEAGRSMARRLGRGLADAGLVVVSGLARGADGAAHAGALEAGGTTVAVLGSGVDVIYPAEHRDLAAAILKSGAIVSELVPGARPLPAHFPLRNRIISGLSMAVVVIEAAEDSGSLITARCALDQGRDVLAVPGSVGSGRYRGSHALIKDGARLVETVDDILDELGWVRPTAKGEHGNCKSLTGSDLISSLNRDEPVGVDEIAEKTGRPVSELLAGLGTLELQGRVGRRVGGYVRLD
jgi:DNA processing protein